MNSTARPSVETSDVWLDVQEEAPADVLEHDEVDISGANATAVPVIAAAPRVARRQC